MNPAQRRLSRQRTRSRGAGWTWLAGLCWLGVWGCAGSRAHVEKNLLKDARAASQDGGVENYRVACPDMVEIRVQDRPQFDARYVIGPDGRIDLGDYGSVRIEGQTPSQIARKIAGEVGVPESQVQVQVAEFRSRRLFLFGEVVDWQRSAPYQGQETVLEVLRRVGGITPGAEPAEVFLVRPRLGEGVRPEVFQVDLAAIVDRGDQATNLRVLPYDQIYLAGNPRSRLGKNLPPWMQTLYHRLGNRTAGTIHGPTK